jgi:drug/metabolite transporter (DMT)-like permease
MVPPGALALVTLSALASGTATALQATAARDAPPADEGLVRAGLGLVRRPAYLVALALIATGFLLAFAALRVLPLFLVQAARASSLGVAAVLAVVFLRASLRRRDVFALVALAAGLVAEGLSVADPHNPRRPTSLVVVLAVAVVAIAAAGLAAVRRGRGRASGVTLAVLAGLCFAVLALAARSSGTDDAGALLTDPVLVVMAAAAGCGLLLGTIAYQRAPVVAVASVMVATETTAATALGWTVAGDRPAAGHELLAVVGLLLVVGGATVIGRFAAPERRLEARAAAGRPEGRVRSGR